MKNKITINEHSSIRIGEDYVIYFDPFNIKGEPKDADLIFITHSHYDHMSEEDMKKVLNDFTFIAVPESCLQDAKKLGKKLGFGEDRIAWFKPGDKAEIDEAIVEAIPAYNVGKQFHPKENNWLGYVVEIDGERIYVAGDTDVTPEAEAVKCDVALLPCGGTYTMTASEAAKLANTIKPAVAIPTHYGSIVGEKSDGETFISLVDSDIKVKILI